MGILNDLLQNPLHGPTTPRNCLQQLPDNWVRDHLNILLLLRCDLIKKGDCYFWKPGHGYVSIHKYKESVNKKYLIFQILLNLIIQHLFISFWTYCLHLECLKKIYLRWILAVFSFLLTFYRLGKGHSVSVMGVWRTFSLIFT